MTWAGGCNCGSAGIGRCGPAPGAGSGRRVLRAPVRPHLDGGARDVNPVAYMGHGPAGLQAGLSHAGDRGRLAIHACEVRAPRRNTFHVQRDARAFSGYVSARRLPGGSRSRRSIERPRDARDGAARPESVARAGGVPRRTWAIRAPREPRLRPEATPRGACCMPTRAGRSSAAGPPAPELASTLRGVMREERVELSQSHHNCVMTKHPGFSSETAWHPGHSVLVVRRAGARLGVARARPGT